MLNFIQNKFSITYRAPSQLGLLDGQVTTQKVYNALPIGSSAMLYDTQVSDPPFVPCFITLDKP